MIAGLCLTWGLGSLVYSLFLADSRSLRRFSLASIGVLFALFVLSLGSCSIFAKKAMEVEGQRAAAQRLEDEKLLQDFRARGFSILTGQSFSIEDDIREPTYFQAQTVKLIGDTAADIVVKAQVCEVYGTVGGNLTFTGQVLTLQPKSVVMGDLDVKAQVLKRSAA